MGARRKELKLTAWEPTQEKEFERRQRRPTPIYDMGVRTNKGMIVSIHNYNRRQGSTALPFELSDLALTPNPSGSAQYNGKGPKVGGITTYLLEITSIEQLQTLTGQSFDLRGPVMDLQSSSIGKFNVRGTIADLGRILPAKFSGLGIDSKLIVNSMVDDISRHCDGYVTQNPLTELGFKDVEFVALPPPRYITPVDKRWLMPGKSHYAEKCSLTVGGDFYLGCWTYITPEGFFDYSLGCVDCYAGHKNKYDPRMTIFKFDGLEFVAKSSDVLEEMRVMRSKAEGREVPRDYKPVIFRFGVSSEPNLPPELCARFGINNQLDIALEAIVKIREKAQGYASFGRKAVPVITTRMPNFSKETLELIKRSGATIMISAGYDSTERGARGLGYGLDRRLIEEKWLRERGYNVAMFAMGDISRPIHEAHPDLTRLMHHYNQERHNGFRIQFLDARIVDAEHAPRIGGAERKDLIDRKQPDLFRPESIENQRFHRTGQNYLAASRMHPSYKEAIGNNTGSLRMCYTHPGPGHEDEAECGNCFINYDGARKNLAISPAIKLGDTAPSFRRGNVIKLHQY